MIARWLFVPRFGALCDSGQGLLDLQARLIRTPLDPLQTFTDDPLRVLRAVRFAARFHYSVAEEVDRAAAHPTIKKHLSNKVSRERCVLSPEVLSVCSRV